jgi:hypothetical protein
VRAYSAFIRSYELSGIKIVERRVHAEFFNMLDGALVFYCRDAKDPTATVPFEVYASGEWVSVHETRT